MRHLSPREFVDLVDGHRSEAASEHLDVCESCRRQLSDIEAAMAAAAQVEVPEPSPLFWERMSERVRAGVAAEESVARAPHPGWREWLCSRRLLSAAAVTVVIVGIVVSGRLIAPEAPTTDPSTVAQMGAPAPTAQPSASSSFAAAAGAEGESGTDVSFEFVTELAVSVDWSATAQDDAVVVGSIENAASQLSDSERRELQQLLRSELTRSGV
jgi:hypothetical protein